ncbi:hypothetical protein [Amycolatopsis thermoflava]|uniref:Uncharacterized protein n=1 Tax=Amycolatopsis thermoflava TaxID=84480 RepID=A0A3N2GTU3_9PSEU|nr:hypothetical protein [Amycolatopsis thermoflava]ROS39385.1 hypothetical protein EDD35_1689 [Amycolatopsis thermoflava]
MSIHVVIQPAAGYGAEVVSPSPGIRQLIAGGEDATFVIQVPVEFGDWCETQNRSRSFPFDSADGHRSNETE